MPSACAGLEPLDQDTIEPQRNQPEDGDGTHRAEEAVRAADQVVVHRQVENGEEVHAEVPEEAGDVQPPEVEQQPGEQRRRRDDRAEDLQQTREDLGLCVAGLGCGSRGRLSRRGRPDRRPRPTGPRRATLLGSGRGGGRPQPPGRRRPRAAAGGPRPAQAQPTAGVAPRTLGRPPRAEEFRPGSVGGSLSVRAPAVRVRSLTRASHDARPARPSSRRRGSRHYSVPGLQPTAFGRHDHRRPTLEPDPLRLRYIGRTRPRVEVQRVDGADLAIRAVGDDR